MPLPTAITSSMLTLGAHAETMRVQLAFNHAKDSLLPYNHAWLEQPMSHRLLLGIEGSSLIDVADITGIYHCCGDGSDPHHRPIRGGPFDMATSLLLHEVFDEDCSIGFGVKILGSPSVLPEIAITLWYVPTRPRCMKPEQRQLELQEVPCG